jgi:hypothetical protein
VLLTSNSSWIPRLSVWIAAAFWMAHVAAVRAQDGEYQWVEGYDLTLEGRGWAETNSPYDRLPAKAEGVVRGGVWGLSKDSAGLCIRFVTAAPTLKVRWALGGSLAMPHMPATGVSGVDLYAQTAGRWRFVGNGRPHTDENEAEFNLDGTADEYCLFLPLYNETRSLQIGVKSPHSLEPAPERGRPVVFYGTSITQGGCASRPGMAASNIFGRALNVPTINLGFSGNGQSEPEMVELVAEIDALVFVLDPLWNMSPDLVRERIPHFVHRLRTAHPTTPILLVEDCRIRAEDVPTGMGKVLREVYAELLAEGIGDLHFLSAEGMLGPSDEGTVDGVHPTDLGFMYQARAFEKALRPLLVPAGQ